MVGAFSYHRWRNKWLLQVWCWLSAPTASLLVLLLLSLPGLGGTSLSAVASLRERQRCTCHPLGIFSMSLSPLLVLVPQTKHLQPGDIRSPPSAFWAMLRSHERWHQRMHRSCFFSPERQCGRQTCCFQVHYDWRWSRQLRLGVWLLMCWNLLCGQRRGLSSILKHLDNSYYPCTQPWWWFPCPKDDQHSV